MKTAWCLLPLLALANSGCLQLPALWRQTKNSDAKPALAAVPPAQPAPPVTPDQVTESNARAKADALDEEITREEEPSGHTTSPEP